MKKFASVLSALCLLIAVTAVAGDKPAKSYQGWVTDQKCTAGVLKKGVGNPACAKKCIESGEKAVFVNESDRSIWPIDNPESIQGLEGQHVSVTGSTTNDVIHIDTAKALPDKENKDGGAK